MMKRYFPKNAEDASALILTLLVIVLLSTIVTSFLSSTRTEQTATRNYTSKTQAEQFATSATQQAMATLQGAFNGNGTGTGVVTSQPGRITKYFFQNGTCTQNATNLFSENGSLFADMNNLSDPASNSSRTNSSSFLSITGNAAESLKVALVNMTSGNQTIGRIAYYIDDEGTKINLNSAAGNRTTINAAYGKGASLTGSANFTGNLITTFDAIINGNATTNSTTIRNWTSFFRPEQALMVLGLNASQMANISTAPPSDYHLKYTPWGTQRLFINDQTIDDAGVCNIYSALTGLNATTGSASASPNAYEINGMALRNIFNGTFSDKYSSNGTKQIAANMLQMRDKNTIDLNFNWRGPILGSGNLSGGIPQSYFAFNPCAIINEVAIQPEQDLLGNTLKICVYVEIWAPFYNFLTADNSNYELVVNLQGASGTSIASLTTQTINRLVPAIGYPNNKKVEKITFSGNATNFNGTLSVTMGDIKLLATQGNASSIRDWITGSVINSLLPINTTLNSTTTVNYTVNSPWTTTANMSSIQRKDIRIKYDSTGTYSANNNSSTSPWGVALHSFISDNSSQFLKIINYASSSGPTGSGTPEAGDIVSRDPLGAYTPVAVSVPFTEYGYYSSDWPPDHICQGRALFNFRFFNYNRYFCPTLFAKDSTGNGLYIWPADLGKVMTDRMYRTLRVYWQPTQERLKGYIPDWALLDLVSFSSNNSTKYPLKISPININGNFNCLIAPTPQPRNNIQCLTKTFDIGGNVSSSIARTISPRSYDNSYPPGNLGNSGWLGAGANVSISMSSNITQHITNNSAVAWTRNGSNTWNSYRTSKNWPSKQLILPSEVAEIKSVSDYTDTPNQNPTWLAQGYNYDHLATTESNENRLAAFFPGLTVCSNFFTIYAYAQALDKAGNVDSEHLTKTLVEVEITTPATATSAAVYKVKSLYTQSIPMGE
jgi:Tfp pilus assembly protein PilX